MGLDSFHPAVRSWFERTFERPTPVQAKAWPAIREGGHTLLAAPTGSGKTLAAFLSAIDDLVREGERKALPDETRVLYVSPLKALSNDIHRNLEEPLAGIRDELLLSGKADVAITALVRTGDTPQHERAKMRRTPPHIVVTTPESLFILLTSESGRSMLSTVQTVIVDEIHAVAGSKRGAHLALSLARLDALCGRPPMRVGLSATQKPMEAVARFLTGRDDCNIVDTGHQRERDLALALPRSPLEAVMANEVWAEIYDQLADLVRAHRTTLIFANNRRQCERVARHLAERMGEGMGEEVVTSHHGSLSRKHRLDAEQRLKAGTLRALVATSSLELGIDIGDVDLVCQLGSPRRIGALLQRVGRAGHAVHATPKGRLFPLSRDDLTECVALLAAVRRGELDRLSILQQPLDVLAQQIVAEVAGQEWGETELFERLQSAWPYRDLTREDFDAVVRMLAEGYTTRRGRRGAYLHRDAVNGRLRARRGARLTALTNGGVIPDQFDYDVVLLPEGFRIGTLNEDFAFESIPGDIFQLGNTSYRICKVAQGKVFAEDAKGQPPNIPFWFGEAPGRSDELSEVISRLRAELDRRLASSEDAAVAWAREELQLDEPAARQFVDYNAASRAALTVLPTRETIVFERFFDETGDQHLVIHSPYGSRINRAWGLALRKRFCRSFNFELQAAADENCIVLSLGATHSFDLEAVSRYLNSASVREVLTQALLDAPMFGTRWRWNASVALAIKRNFNGKRAPAPFQRSDAEDLLAVVFPDQLACAENLSAGYRDIPDHPLVRQTVHDCLLETMDVDGLEKLLAQLEAGDIRIICRDLAAPSPMAFEILGARPYAFLDDAPAEERRTLAVRQRSVLSAEEAAALGQLDAEAIAKVRAEAWPDARTADELHDALLVMAFLTEREGEAGRGEGLAFGWTNLFQELMAAGRAARLTPPEGDTLWVAAERLDWFRKLWPAIQTVPSLGAIPDPKVADPDALREILRGRLEALGPVTAESLAAPLGVGASDLEAALAALQNEGFAMQGRYTGSVRVEWCERGLLARIHRYTLKRLRAEIEPVTPTAYYRFLLRWQHLAGDRVEGPEALAAVLEQLEGYPAAASVWETSLLPLRIGNYDPALLDRLCNAGRFVWTRLNPPRLAAQAEDSPAGRHSAPVRNTPIAFVARSQMKHWRALARDGGDDRLSGNAEVVLAALREHGALFFADLEEATSLLHSQLELALGELVARGRVTADTFAGLRALIGPQLRRADTRRLRRRARAPGVEDAGRWAIVFTGGRPATNGSADGEHVTHIAEVLLRRYGVVCRRVLEREPLLPPWRELLYVFRRKEARGELRGGRFVQGMSGEQFALPEAIGALREARSNADGEEIMLSAADPLNLVGIITPGQRLSSLPGNRLLLKDGVPVAVRSGKQVEFLKDIPSSEEWNLRRRLMGPFGAASARLASRRPSGLR